MSILYLAAFIDRSNIGNARVAGLQIDLSISDNQYQPGKFVDGSAGSQQIAKL